ncbi:hypothetical protein V8G54_036054 [Vigna mungo]|uniref:Uncharacterized protein n=1 Tax=Vigna mungo TaxID=3915 RepID=A0AAQ3MG85_VIGMU
MSSVATSNRLQNGGGAVDLERRDVVFSGGYAWIPIWGLVEEKWNGVTGNGLDATMDVAGNCASGEGYGSHIGRRRKGAYVLDEEEEASLRRRQHEKRMSSGSMKMKVLDSRKMKKIEEKKSLGTARRQTPGVGRFNRRRRQQQRNMCRRWKSGESLGVEMKKVKVKVAMESQEDKRRKEKATLL